MKNKMTFGRMFPKGAIEFNPVLIQCVGLCPVIIASANLKDSFLVSVTLLIDMVICSFIASAVLKKVQRYIRNLIYLIIGLLIVCPILRFVESNSLVDLTLGMKIFIPLVAVNSATAVHCEKFAVNNDVRSSVFDSLAAGLGISFVLLICGALREILGSGTLAGVTVNESFVLSGFSMPCGCLVILGFLAAALNAVYSGKNKKQKIPPKDAPEEIELDITSDDSDGSDDNNIEEIDEEYDYLLASVNELIASFSKNDGGDGK